MKSENTREIRLEPYRVQHKERLTGGIRITPEAEQIVIDYQRRTDQSARYIVSQIIIQAEALGLICAEERSQRKEEAE